jgi:hypothetical protein
MGVKLNMLLCVVAIKNAWKYTVSYIFLVKSLNKHRNKHIFLLYFMKYIPNQTSREMHAWGKNNTERQSYRHENLSHFGGVIMLSYCLGILNEGHALPSMNALVQALK